MKLLRWLKSIFRPACSHFLVENTDGPLSHDGRWAVLAGLWMPPATCKRCGAKEPGFNQQWARENGWLRESGDSRNL